MKKLLFVFLCLIIFTTGCDKEEEVETLDLVYDEEYYEIATPFKESVSKNYSINSISNYDIEEIENMLMYLSTSYYKTNNSLYQDGQYLTSDILKDLLSSNKLNNADPIKINNKKVKPKYISYIYEQNYLANNKKLKGLSLAIVLNPYQEYTNIYGTKMYTEVPEKQVIEFGKKQINSLLTYLRENLKIKNKIVVGLYVCNDPNSILPGSFRYIGSTNGKSVNLKKTNYQYHLLDSDFVIANDTNTYNNYKNINKIITSKFETTYISGIGLYNGNHIKNIEITITTNYLSKNSLLYLSQLLSKESSKLFNSEISLKIYIKNNSELKCLIIKPKNTLKTNMYILKG